MTNPFKRIFLIVLDSFGIGGAPDAAAYGDEGSDTFGSIYRFGFRHENLKKLGLFHIDGVSFGERENEPIGSYARMQEASAGKDTTTGHWEIAGIRTDQPFDVFPDGFPKSFISEFEERAGVKVLCNRPYSGTQVIADYGEEHRRSGALIVYTSADSVFQIAAHEEIVPVEQLYEYCRIARELLNKRYRVGRVIARPFLGEEGNFFRTPKRHDFSLLPPHTMLDSLKDAGYDVIGVGKIGDIFAGKGLTKSLGVNKDNADGMKKTAALLKEDFFGLAFVNLVDGDSVYGHRRDVKGYASCVSEFDDWLGSFLPDMREEDLLMITADHGCDPCFKGTDHTRECVPLLMYGKRLPAKNLGTRKTFADVSAFILKNYHCKIIDGESLF